MPELPIGMSMDDRRLVLLGRIGLEESPVFQIVYPPITAIIEVQMRPVPTRFCIKQRPLGAGPYLDVLAMCLKFQLREVTAADLQNSIPQTLRRIYCLFV